MKQLSLFRPYVRPLTFVGQRDLPMKFVHSCFNPSLSTVCDKLCQFHGDCSRFFSDRCSRADWASSFKLSHYF